MMNEEETFKIGGVGFAFGLILALLCIPFAILILLGFNDLHGVITIYDALLVTASFSFGGWSTAVLAHFKLRSFERKPE